MSLALWVMLWELQNSIIGKSWSIIYQALVMSSGAVA